jgi:nucleotide-binding universal stress UspA family protein
MFKSIVLALDGSESSDRALELATELAKEEGSSVLVVHVREIAVGRAGGPVPVNEDEMQAKVEGQVNALTGAGIGAKLEIHSAHVGAPAHVIADTAQRENADVIITGTRGHTPIAGILLGSVPQRLLHVAHCPVLVVPHRA